MTIEYEHVKRPQYARPWVFALGCLFIVGGGLLLLLLLAILPLSWLVGESFFDDTADTVIGSAHLVIAAVISVLAIYAGIGLLRGRCFALPWCIALCNSFVYMVAMLAALAGVRLLADGADFLTALNVEDYFVYGFMFLFGALGFGISRFLSSPRLHDSFVQADPAAASMRSAAFLTLALLALNGPPPEFMRRVINDEEPNPLGWSLIAVTLVGHFLVFVMSLQERRGVIWFAWAVILLYTALCFVTIKNVDPILSSRWFEVYSMASTSVAFSAVFLAVFGNSLRPKPLASPMDRIEFTADPAVATSPLHATHATPANQPPPPNTTANDPP